MLRMLRGRVLALATGGLVLTASGAVAVTSLPDAESDFLSSVREYGGGWVSRIPDGTLIAEGQHACDWLALQPEVSGPAREQKPYELFSRFIEGVDPTPGWHYGNGRGLRGTVSFDAWNYLCPDVYDSRTWQPETPEDD